MCPFFHVGQKDIHAIEHEKDADELEPVALAQNQDVYMDKIARERALRTDPAYCSDRFLP